MTPYSPAAIRTATGAASLSLALALAFGPALPAGAACVGTVPLADGGMKGGISGYDSCDFRVELKAGQVLAPTLVAPDGFLLQSVGDHDHDFAKGPLTAPEDGTYTVRVRQLRAVARKHPEIRGYTIHFGDAAALPAEASWKPSLPVATD